MSTLHVKAGYTPKPKNRPKIIVPIRKGHAHARGWFDQFKKPERRPLSCTTLAKPQSSLHTGNTCSIPTVDAVRATGLHRLSRKYPTIDPSRLKPIKYRDTLRQQIRRVLWPILHKHLAK